MGRDRAQVLSIVRQNPGIIDAHVHRVLGRHRLPESTVKHLLRLRDAGFVRCEGDVRLGRRRWFAADYEVEL